MGLEEGLKVGLTVGLLLTVFTVGLAVEGLDVGSFVVLAVGAGVEGVRLVHLEGGLADIRQICCSIQVIPPETRE